MDRLLKRISIKEKGILCMMHKLNSMLINKKIKSSEKLLKKFTNFISVLKIYKNIS